MKKTKFLVLVLAAAIMLMGAGYALWDEVIPLNASVNSTYLNVALEGRADTVYIHPDTHPDADRDYIKLDPEDYGSSCSVRFGANKRGKAGANTNSTATVKFNNLFPGVTQTASIDFINDSLIPVQLEQVLYKLAEGSSDDVLDLITIETNSEDKDGAGKFYSLYDLLYTYGGGDGEYSADEYREIYPSVVLQPGETFTYIVRASIPFQSGNYSQLKNIEFNITHTWEQWNDVDAGTVAR